MGLPLVHFQKYWLLSNDLQDRLNRAQREINWKCRPVIISRVFQVFFRKKILRRKRKSESKFVKLLYSLVWAITFTIFLGFFQVWELYRRNFHKGRKSAPTRKTCIRQDKISTGNPCPICRDEYLLVDYQNLKLIEQFIDEYSGLIYSTKKTGVCQTQNKKLLLAIDKARDLGILTIDQPFVEYDYSKYNR